MTLFDAEAAIAAVGAGTIDASFRAVARPARERPDGIRAVRVFDEAIQLLTGPAHELAAARSVGPAQRPGTGSGCPASWPAPSGPRSTTRWPPRSG